MNATLMSACSTLIYAVYRYLYKCIYYKFLHSLLNEKKILWCFVSFPTARHKLHSCGSRLMCTFAWLRFALIFACLAFSTLTLMLVLHHTLVKIYRASFSRDTLVSNHQPLSPDNQNGHTRKSPLVRRVLRINIFLFFHSSLNCWLNIKNLLHKSRLIYTEFVNLASRWLISVK